MREEVRALLKKCGRTQRWLRFALEDRGRIINIVLLNDYLTGARKTKQGDEVIALSYQILKEEEAHETNL